MIGHVNESAAKTVNNPEALNAAMKVLITPKDGWNGYVMRLFEIEEYGYTPKHRHAWPHINYIIEGAGELLINDVMKPVKPGSYAFVPGNALHQFKNTGTGTFKFICIVPEEGHKL